MSEQLADKGLVILDRDGVITARISGETNIAALSAMLDEMLVDRAGRCSAALDPERRRRDHSRGNSAGHLLKDSGGAVRVAAMDLDGCLCRRESGGRSRRDDGPLVNDRDVIANLFDFFHPVR